MHSHLLQVLLVTCLVLPCLGTALKEEDTRKGKRTKEAQDIDSLKGEEGEAGDDKALTISNDKNDGLEMWNPLGTERKNGNEKRATRKGKRTTVEQDTKSQGEEETILGYNVLSEDKKEGSGILNPLEAEKKNNEKRATRKGKRVITEQNTDSQDEEDIGQNVLTLSQDKKQGSEILNPLEVEKKRNEKRATRKGKRVITEQDTDSQGEEAIGHNLLTQFLKTKTKDQES